MVTIQALREKLKILDVSYGTGTGNLCNQVIFCQIKNPRTFLLHSALFSVQSNTVS